MFVSIAIHDNESYPFIFLVKYQYANPAVVVALIFPIMAAAMPQAVVFAIFGVICFLGVLFIRFFVPETRGRSLQEIENNSGNESKKIVSTEN